MEKGENFIDAIYSRFVLRDAFGKMVPGSILLGTIIGSNLEFPLKVNLIKEIPFWAWLGFFGLSWIIAFGLQSFGERVELIKYLPDDVNQDEWYRDYMQFHMNVKTGGVRQHERLVVIMEACGNTAIALGASFVFLIIKALFLLGLSTNKATLWTSWKTELPNIAPIIIISVLLMWFLHRMHSEHRSRHYNILKKGLDQMKNQQGQEATQTQ